MKKNTLLGIVCNTAQNIFRYCATLFLLLISFLSVAQPDTWQRKLPAGAPVRAAVSFTINNKGYVGTGYSNEGLYMSGDYAINNLWEYDAVSNVWTQKANYGGGATGDATGFSIGTKGYIAKLGTTDNFWEYNPATNNWIQKTDFAGVLTTGATGFNIGGNGYIATGSASNNFWAYNPITNNWTQKADFAGTARSNAVGFSIDNKGYLGTGYNGTDYKSDFWEYNPISNTWTQKADYAGGPVTDATGFSIYNKGYIGTGTSAGYGMRNDFWEYDPAANLWTQKANFSGLVRYQATGFCIDGKGYIGTGVNGFGSWENIHYPNDFYQFDPTENVWSRKADFGPTVKLTSQVYSSSFSIGSKGYIFNEVAETNSGDFFEYDPATNTLLQKANFAGIKRRGAVGLSIANKGYIGLGYTGETALRDFWEYDPVTDSWTQKADFKGVGRRGAIAFSIAGKGYIGSGRGIFNYNNDFWEYNPPTNTWTQKADFGGGERVSGVGFSIAGKGYAGTGAAGIGLTKKKDFWEYDPLTDIWTQKADFGGGERWLATGFSIGNKGFIGTGYCCSSDFWEYNPSANTWIQRANFGGGDRFAATGFSIGNKGYLGTGNGFERDNKDLWEYTPVPENIITTTTVPAVLCPAVPFTVSFTATGIYNTGNVFTAQLSNASGDFTTPVNIGNKNGTTAGFINAVLPAGTITGSGYRIRVVSSNLYTEGSAIATTVDNQAPVITGAFANPSVLWPPNKKMVNVSVYYLTVDNCSNQINNTLSVISNEPQSALGDWIIIDDHHLKLRADRLGNGTGRVYTITITATDASGNSSNKSVTVCVPHDQTNQNSMITGTNNNVINEEELLISKKISVTVQPNPSSNYFILMVSSSNVKPIVLKVTDLAGRIIETRNNAANKGRIQIGESYLPGVYFVQVIQGNETSIVKLIKQSQ